jgi:hypothetical protein
MKFLPLLTLLFLPILSPGQEPPAPAPDENPEIPGTSPIKMAEEVKQLDFLKRADEVVAKIRDSKRQMDPFGMPMDPTNMVASPILSEQYGDLDEVPTLNSSSLKNALDTLPISGVYPSKGKIVLGARSFNRGDVFGMKLEELTIRLRFEGIKGHSIFFKDLDTQEVATVDFNTKPKEFEPITSSSAPAPLKGIQRMNELFIVN